MAKCEAQRPAVEQALSGALGRKVTVELVGGRAEPAAVRPEPVEPVPEPALEPEPEPGPRTAAAGTAYTPTSATSG